MAESRAAPVSTTAVKEVEVDFSDHLKGIRSINIQHVSRHDAYMRVKESMESAEPGTVDALKEPHCFVIQDQVKARSSNQWFSFVLSFHKNPNQLLFSMSR